MVINVLNALPGIDSALMTVLGEYQEQKKFGLKNEESVEQ